MKDIDTYLMRKMHAIAKELGLDHDALRARAAEISKRELASMSDLTTNQRDAVVDRLNADLREHVARQGDEAEAAEAAAPEPTPASDVDLLFADLRTVGLEPPLYPSQARRQIAHMLVARGWTKGGAA